MKILLVSNGNLAASLIDSMQHYFSNAPLHAVCFELGHTERGKSELAAYFDRTNSANESYLIFCDIFGSTACNEVNILIQQRGLSNRSLVICGMNLPMIFKAYGLIDTNDLSLFEILYAMPNIGGIQICARTA